MNTSIITEECSGIIEWDSLSLKVLHAAVSEHLRKLKTSCEKLYVLTVSTFRRRDLIHKNCVSMTSWRTPFNLCKGSSTQSIGFRSTISPVENFYSWIQQDFGAPSTNEGKRPTKYAFCIAHAAHALITPTAYSCVEPTSQSGKMMSLWTKT